MGMAENVVVYVQDSRVVHNIVNCLTDQATLEMPRGTT